MTLRLILQLLLLGSLMTVPAYGQEDPPPSVDIGDPAPPLRLRAWFKGTPIHQFEKGTIYVVEFWATWCSPCKASMPRLSDLARQYKDKITFLSIDVYEKTTTPIEKIKHFVDSMGPRMDYAVAAEDSNFMVAEWLDSAREKGIPKSFVVDAEGRLAWIGHPSHLERVLPPIVNNRWDVQAAATQKKLQRHLEWEDLDQNFELSKFRPSPDKPNDPGHPDSILLAIGKIVEKEPGLKYAPHMAYNTFSALLKTDPHKAYAYGKEVLSTPFFGDTSFSSVIDPIEYNATRVKIPAEIYRLAAEAIRMSIAQFPYPEIIDIPKQYHQMADYCWRAGDKSKAIETEQKAIDILKERKGHAAKDLAIYQARLQQYKNPQ